MFEGFEALDVATPRGNVHALIAGSGPPLLLLHGFPQTHLMWHAVAPPLAERYTTVVADLPGYGDSFRPEPSHDHSAHSKRALADDLLAAMGRLGHSTFFVAGHDRGGRVAYRMALEHPEAVSRLAVLDIVPTGELWSHADHRLAVGYWHWGFLAQPPPLPERLILGDPDAFWIAGERMGIKPADERFPDEVVAAYRAQLHDPEAVTAMCEDYRAGATIDRALDQADKQAGRTVSCPALALWGADGALPIFYDDPLELWRHLAPQVAGRAVERAGHFIPEDQPGEVVTELVAFFG